jgi:heme-degrading monooxygenase HmoA
MAMYFTKQDFQVRIGRQTDWEAFAGKLFSLMEQHGGLDRVSNLNSLGYPTKYTIAALWDSREHAREFSRSDALCQLLNEAEPQQSATPLTSIEAFEVVHRVGTGRAAKVGYIIDQKVEAGPGRVEAYENARLSCLSCESSTAPALWSISLPVFSAAAIATWCSAASPMPSPRQRPPQRRSCCSIGASMDRRRFRSRSSRANHMNSS